MYSVDARLVSAALRMIVLLPGDNGVVSKIRQNMLILKICLKQTMSVRC